MVISKAYVKASISTILMLLQQIEGRQENPRKLLGSWEMEMELTAESRSPSDFQEIFDSYGSG